MRGTRLLTSAAALFIIVVCGGAALKVQAVPDPAVDLLGDNNNNEQPSSSYANAAYDLPHLQADIPGALLSQVEEYRIADEAPWNLHIEKMDAEVQQQEKQDDSPDVVGTKQDNSLADVGMLGMLAFDSSSTSERATDEEDNAAARIDVTASATTTTEEAPDYYTDGSYGAMPAGLYDESTWEDALENEMKWEEAMEELEEELEDIEEEEMWEEQGIETPLLETIATYGSVATDVATVVGQLLNAGANIADSDGGGSPREITVEAYKTTEIVPAETEEEDYNYGRTADIPSARSAGAGGGAVVYETLEVTASFTPRGEEVQETEWEDDTFPAAEPAWEDWDEEDNSWEAEPAWEESSWEGEYDADAGKDKAATEKADVVEHEVAEAYGDKASAAAAAQGAASESTGVADYATLRSVEKTLDDLEVSSMIVGALLSQRAEEEVLSVYPRRALVQPTGPGGSYIPVLKNARLVVQVDLYKIAVVAFVLTCCVVVSIRFFESYEDQRFREEELTWQRRRAEVMADTESLLPSVHHPSRGGGGGDGNGGDDNATCDKMTQVEPEARSRGAPVKEAQSQTDRSSPVPVIVASLARPVPGHPAVSAREDATLLSLYNPI